MSDELTDDLDFSNFDGIDNLDWSDVEDDLKKNQEMIIQDSNQSESNAPTPAKAVNSSNIDISFLLDVPLRLTVVVGNKKMLIKNLLELEVDHILELNKEVGKPLNIYINEKLVASGEVIIQNEKFGLKITEIIDEKSRLQSIIGNI